MKAWAAKAVHAFFVPYMSLISMVQVPNEPLRIGIVAIGKGVHREVELSELFTVEQQKSTYRQFFPA